MVQKMIIMWSLCPELFDHRLKFKRRNKTLNSRVQRGPELLRGNKVFTGTDVPEADQMLPAGPQSICVFHWNWTKTLCKPRKPSLTSILFPYLSGGPISTVHLDHHLCSRDDYQSSYQQNHSKYVGLGYMYSPRFFLVRLLMHSHHSILI